MCFTKPRSSKKKEHWTTVAVPARDIPDVRSLGEGFFECIVHYRGQLFRGLARDRRGARSRALSLAGKSEAQRETNE
jgi:hypothetical protein